MKKVKVIQGTEIENFMIMNPMAVYLDLRDSYASADVDGFIKLDYKGAYDVILAKYHRDQKIVITAMTEQKLNIISESLIRYGYNHVYIIEGDL